MAAAVGSSSASTSASVAAAALAANFFVLHRAGCRGSRSTSSSSSRSFSLALSAFPHSLSSQGVSSSSLSSSPALVCQSKEYLPQRRRHHDHRHCGFYSSSSAPSSSCSSALESSVAGEAFLPRLPRRFYFYKAGGAMAPSKPPAPHRHPVKAVLTADVGLTKPAETTLPDISLTSGSEVGQWKGDILTIGVFESAEESKDRKLSSLGLGALDLGLGGILGEIVAEEDFSGKTGQTSSARVSGHGFKRLSVVGLGKPGGAVSSLKPWRTLGESVATTAKPAQAKTAAILVANAPKLSAEAKLGAASAIASGAILGVFEDLRFKSESKPPSLKSIEILGLGSGPDLDDKLSQAVKLAAGIILARQLVNAPPNVLIPSVLADEAENLAAEFSDVLTVKILDEKACKDSKMGSYLGVAFASTNPPRFIHIQYRPPSNAEVKRRVAIVGKGLTFDSGGYNLKTGVGSSIELMKFDMGGAAAAIGAAKAIAAIKPPGVEVNFIVAACENMISGGGMRPGDILTASNGKTIEVNNTDAEGRLTLADALVYACRLKVDKIVDLATLTGACVVALGNEIAGLFTPNDDLAAELSSASHLAGEKLWRLPMEESYWEMMKSGIADMVNTGGRPGGSITAALFLKQFVDEHIAWAHIDMAGPVWSSEKKSGTGFAVATLLNWVLKQSSS